LYVNAIQGSEPRLEPAQRTPASRPSAPAGHALPGRRGDRAGVATEPTSKLRQGGVSMHPRRTSRALRLSGGPSGPAQPVGVRAGRACRPDEASGCGEPAHPGQPGPDLGHQPRALGSRRIGLRLDGRDRSRAGRPGGQHDGSRAEGWR